MTTGGSTEPLINAQLQEQMEDEGDIDEPIRERPLTQKEKAALAERQELQTKFMDPYFQSYTGSRRGRIRNVYSGAGFDNSNFTQDTNQAFVGRQNAFKTYSGLGYGTYSGANMPYALGAISKQQGLRYDEALKRYNNKLKAYNVQNEGLLATVVTQFGPIREPKPPAQGAERVAKDRQKVETRLQPISEDNIAGFGHTSSKIIGRALNAVQVLLPGYAFKRNPGTNVVHMVNRQTYEIFSPGILAKTLQQQLNRRTGEISGESLKNLSNTIAILRSLNSYNSMCRNVGIFVKKSMYSPQQIVQQHLLSLTRGVKNRLVNAVGAQDIPNTGSIETGLALAQSRANERILNGMARALASKASQQGRQDQIAASRYKYGWTGVGAYSTRPVFAKGSNLSYGNRQALAQFRNQDLGYL